MPPIQKQCRKCDSTFFVYPSGDDQEACSLKCRRVRAPRTKEARAITGRRISEAIASRSPEIESRRVERFRAALKANGQLEKRGARSREYWAQFSPEERREKMKPMQLKSRAGATAAAKRPKSRDRIEKQRASLRRYYEDPANVQRNSDAQKAAWARDKANGRPGWTGQHADTSIEIAVRTVLDALGVDYLQGQKVIGYWPDFLIPSKMLIIECDGKYWHEMPGRADHDALRDRKLRGLGYTVIRLLETEINSNATTAVIGALKAVA